MDYLSIIPDNVLANLMDHGIVVLKWNIKQICFNTVY